MIITSSYKFGTSERLLKHIQEKSNFEKKKWQSEHLNEKMLSTSRMYNSCVKQFNADEVALKASMNPNSKYWGKNVEDIKNEWKEKATTGINRGNIVDDALTALFKKQKFEYDSSDTQIIGKLQSIENFVNTYSKNLHTYIGSEIWLASNELGCNVRCDSMFVDTDRKIIYICEWKNTNSISTSNKYSKCFGPLSGYDDCDLLKYNLQVYTYKYILESYGLDDYEIRVMIVQFTEFEYAAQPLLLDSVYKTLIPKLAKYSYDFTSSTEQ